MSFFSAPPSQGRGVAADDVEKHATPCRGLILRKCLGEFGWGTWIFTEVPSNHLISQPFPEAPDGTVSQRCGTVQRLCRKCDLSLGVPATGAGALGVDS